MGMRKLAAAAAGIALAVSLGACSGGQPGAAAVINGKSYSEDGVATAASQLSTMMGQEFKPADIVQLVYQASVYNQTAQAMGVEVTDQQVDDFVAAQAAQIQPIEGSMNPVTRDLWRMIIEQNQLTSGAVDLDQANAAFTEALTTTDAKANPRYGSFDESGQLTQAPLGDVVDLSGGASAGAGADGATTEDGATPQQ